MSQHDTIQRFIIERLNLRGEIIRLHDTYRAVSERHVYPEEVRKTLGEGLAAVALLSATLKFEGSIILQIESDGAINLLVVQSDHQFQLRGLAQWQPELLSLTDSHILGKGRLAITITPKQGERYQGIVNLTNGGLADSLETYFRQSEQLATCLCLWSEDETVTGMLLQLMPHNTGESAEMVWAHYTQMMKAISSHEFNQFTNQEIIQKLFYAEDVCLYDAEKVAFHCGCSVERMERALRLWDQKEIQELLRLHKKVTVTCEFCNNQYDFDAGDVARLRGHIWN